jgi:hypothetical protein
MKVHLRLIMDAKSGTARKSALCTAGWPGNLHFHRAFPLTSKGLLSVAALGFFCQQLADASCIRIRLTVAAS